MSGYTKGPWHTCGDSGYSELEGTRVGNSQGYVLAVAIGDVPELKGHEANAHLIAAAPDMYEALKLFAELATHHAADAEEWDDSDSVRSMISIGDLRSVTAALAKAKGE